ncbi:uncharacterized protein METZ01_LOCUS289947 [marine metagenome]|uniref:Uncharacterized protein n=1 Tax=marine metagenome TaxID=408172 RepID=A0A382LLC9_9ZZZZ
MQPIEGMVPGLPTSYNEEETIDAPSLRLMVDFVSTTQR